MLRTVADETPSPLSPASSDEATGSPVALYSRTRAASTPRDRSLDPIGTRSWRLLQKLYTARYGPPPGGGGKHLKEDVLARQTRGAVARGISRDCSTAGTVRR